MTKRQIAVAYIESNGISFYTKNTNAVRLNIPLDVVSDLEVVNREKLEGIIDGLFQSQGIKGLEFDVILVFSVQTSFDKDFTGDSKTRHEQMQQFLEMVPFEDVLSNSYDFNAKTKVV